MTQKQRHSAPRIAVFDGLKGISMIMILFFYFFEHILPGGYLAVNSFLLIAGFFNVRYFYLKSLKKQPANIWLFVKKRIERLFFPMFAMIITTIPIILIFARDLFFNIRNMAIASIFFVNNFYQIINKQSYFVQAANPSAFTHLWYVSLLGQLLILTPVFMILFYNWHKKPAIAANFFMVISAISAFLLAYWYKDGQDPTNVYYSLITRLFAYTLGGTVAMILPPNLKAKPMPKKIKHIFNSITLIGVILLFFMSKFMYGTMPFAYNFGMVLFTLVFMVVLVLSIHPDTLFNKIFSIKPLTFLGKRSYSIYVWYYPVYLVVPKLMGSLAKELWILITVQVLLLLLLTEFSYRIFEKQLISLPIGQDFNLTKTRKQLKFLRLHPNQYTLIKVMTGAYAVFLSVSLIGAMFAPESKSDTAGQLQEMLEENKKVAQKTQQKEKNTPTVINNVDGLTQEENIYVNGQAIYFYGDSVLLSASKDIEYIFPKANVNSEIGRQLYQSVDDVRWLASEDILPDNVVTVLGSNGTFTQSQINDYIEAIGKDRTQYFVTAKVDKPWGEDANRQIYEAEKRYGNVKVIDWLGHSIDHPEWFYEDSTHPNEEGSRQFALLIAKEVYRQR